MDVTYQNDPTSTTGPLYVVDDSDEDISLNLAALKTFLVFVIQKKTAVDYFSSNVTHEIMDHKKNVLLKATRPRSLFYRKPSPKITVKDLRGRKLFSIVVESTNSLDASQTEASIYVYHQKRKKRIAHVEKYGGTFGPPAFEIFNADGKTAFTVDLKETKAHASVSSSVLDYDISTKRATVGNILMKTGLNMILSTHSSFRVIEKATLLAVILGMDLLKTGIRDKEAIGNQYMFH